MLDYINNKKYNFIYSDDQQYQFTLYNKLNIINTDTSCYIASGMHSCVFAIKCTSHSIIGDNIEQKQLDGKIEEELLVCKLTLIKKGLKKNY